MKPGIDLSKTHQELLILMSEMKEKKILIVSQVIPQWYVDLLKNTFGETASVDIITGSDVKGKTIHSPEHNPSSFKSRLISWYKHYRFMMRWIRVNKDREYNLIFAISNPPINAMIGLKLKKTFKAPFIYMNWDLYPQVIRAEIHNPLVELICNQWSNWNNKNYSKINQIITIGDVMADSLNADIKEKLAIKKIPIGVDANRLKPIEKKDNPFCINNKLIDKFIVLYSGKMGLGHNIEMILSASERLMQHKEIVFVFIGFGSKYNTVKDYIELHHSENIRLFPLQDENVFPYSMACGDIGIVSQESSMAHLFMPSKVYSMMACGEAIIGISTDHDDLSILINEKDIGKAVTDESSDTLAKTIYEMYKNKEMLNRYKCMSRKVAVEEFNLPIIKKKYIELFKPYLE